MSFFDFFLPLLTDIIFFALLSISKCITFAHVMSCSFVNVIQSDKSKRVHIARSYSRIQRNSFTDIAEIALSSYNKARLRINGLLIYKIAKQRDDLYVKIVKQVATNIKATRYSQQIIFHLYKSMLKIVTLKLNSNLNFLIFLYKYVS